MEGFGGATNQLDPSRSGVPGWNGGHCVLRHLGMRQLAQMLQIASQTMTARMDLTHAVPTRNNHPFHSVRTH